MIDEEKTKEHLVDELAVLRQRIGELELLESEHQQTRQALQEMDGRIVHILESITEAFFALDHQGRLTYINRQAEQFMQRPREELLGKNIWEEFPEAARLIFFEKYQKTVSEQRSVKFEGYYPPFDKWFDVHVYPSQDGVSVYFDDITERKRVEEALRENHSILQAVIEGITDAVFLKDLQGRYLMINSAGANFLGKTVEEVVGKDDTELFSPDTARTTMERDRKVIASGKTETYESIGTAAGVTRAYLSTKGVYRDQYGKILGLFGIARDITEQKRKDEALKVLLRQQASVAVLGLRALGGVDLQSLMDEGVALVAEKLDVAYSAVFELLPESGSLLLRAGNGWKEGIVGRAKIGAGLDSQIGYTLLLLNQPVIVEDFRAESRFHRPRLLRDHGVVSGISVIIYTRGHSFGVLSAHTTRPRTFTEDDIHFLQAVANVLAAAIERKQTEEALRESEERYRFLFENNPQPMWVYDLEALFFLTVNNAAVDHYGYSRDEFLNMTIKEIRPPEDLPDFLRNHSMATATGENSEAVWRHKKKDGAIIYVEVVKHPVFFAGRQAMLVLANDITERKRTEAIRARLLEWVISVQEQERKWIARELHDETGQSLTSLLVGLRMIEDAKTLKAAKTEAKRLRQVTAQTIDDVNRLARGLHPSILDDLGLSEALAYHAKEYSKTYGINVNIHTEGLASNRLESTVEIALYRIVLEALTNIAKHAAAKNIDIVIECRPGGVQVIIEDDGGGFDVKATLQASSDHLGIYGMRERAALLGGWFMIESRQGKGTIICVQIPFQKGSALSDRI